MLNATFLYKDREFRIDLPLKEIGTILEFVYKFRNISPKIVINDEGVTEYEIVNGRVIYPEQYGLQEEMCEIRYGDVSSDFEFDDALDDYNWELKRKIINNEKIFITELVLIAISNRDGINLLDVSAYKPSGIFDKNTINQLVLDKN